MTQLNELGARQVARLVAEGKASAEEVVDACLARIAAREGAVGAFSHVDPDAARAQARAVDNGAASGPLKGVPLGIKDIIATRDMPTTNGSPIYAGNRPAYDASCVSVCRAAGATVLGKTVTTEFAYFFPGKTRNPHNLEHTTGGSSMGSAAGVADFMFPLGFGSQTAASVTRPAAYCGVIGYKATTGDFDLQGVCGLSASFDTLGFLCRELEDIALMREVMLGDPEPSPRAEASPLRIALVRTPHWDKADAATRRVVEGAAATLAGAGARVDEPALPKGFDDLAETHGRIMAFDAARARAWEYNEHRDQLSPQFAALVESGRAVAYGDYRAAHDHAADCRSRFDAWFADYDVVIAPSAPGEAPAGLKATGDPLFSRMWTLLHVPSVTLPVGKGDSGLPIGVQVIGRTHRDGKMIADAQWVYDRLR
jgi:Asp-tRNA(Asn)/Glu-tRNA(Gln) amidotransferase A subunit family amidase